MPALATGFRPTRAQLRLYRHMGSTPAGATLAMVLTHARVSRASYYRWCRQPGFAHWLAAAWQETTSPLAHLPTVRDLRCLDSAPLDPACFNASFKLRFGPQGLLAVAFPALPLPLLAAENEHSNKTWRRTTPLVAISRFEFLVSRCRATLVARRAMGKCPNTNSDTTGSLAAAP